MAEPLTGDVLAPIGKAEELYYRLMLIAELSGSRKTAGLQRFDLTATRSGEKV